MQSRSTFVKKDLKQEWLTASVLKQDPDTSNVQENAICQDKTRAVDLSGQNTSCRFVRTKHELYVFIISQRGSLSEARGTCT